MTGSGQAEAGPTSGPALRLVNATPKPRDTTACRTGFSLSWCNDGCGQDESLSDIETRHSGASLAAPESAGQDWAGARLLADHAHAIRPAHDRNLGR